MFKSDPITFATADIGWYLVQVNANDVATSGAAPRWLMLTMLLPEGTSTPAAVEQWAEDTASSHGFSQLTHTLEISGVCGDCAAEAAL